MLEGDPHASLLGVAGKPFSRAPRTEFGNALTAAESESGGGKLVVTRWRDGTLAELAGALQSSLDTDDAAPQLLQRLIDDEILKPAP